MAARGAPRAWVALPASLLLPLAVGLLLATAGCADPRPAGAPTGGAGPGAAPAWTQPDRYSFVVESSCGERSFIGRFHVTVADGRVVALRSLDESPNPIPSGGIEPEPTLANLLAEVQQARNASAHVATVDVDPADGHPTRIDIDPVENAVDDESCYRVSEYRVG